MKRLKFLMYVLVIFIIGLFFYINSINNTKYSIDDNLVEQLSSNIPTYTKLEEIPEDLKNAVISIEDQRFYKHYGFDVISLGRAFTRNLKEGEIKEGGSTITQQLAKNLFLSQEQTFDRKLKELILAIKLEYKCTKDEILEMYLNVIYYGSGAYGIADASAEYFNKNVSDLTLSECAMLAGLPQAPSAYNPNKHLDKAQKRQSIVLKVMLENGFIDKESKTNAENEIIFAGQ